MSNSRILDVEFLFSSETQVGEVKSHTERGNAQQVVPPNLKVIHLCP